MLKAHLNRIRSGAKGKWIPLSRAALSVTRSLKLVRTCCLAQRHNSNSSPPHSPAGRASPYYYQACSPASTRPSSPHGGEGTMGCLPAVSPTHGPVVGGFAFAATGPMAGPVRQQTTACSEACCQPGIHPRLLTVSLLPGHLLCGRHWCFVWGSVRLLAVSFPLFPRTTAIDALVCMLCFVRLQSMFISCCSVCAISNDANVL